MEIYITEKSRKSNSYKTVSQVYIELLNCFCSWHISMTELCRELFKYENERNDLIYLTENLLVHSNETARRKRGRLGMEPVWYYI